MDLFGRKAALKMQELETKISEQAKILAETPVLLESKISELAEVQEKANTNKLQLMMRNFNTQIFPNYTTVREQKAYQSSPNIYSVVSEIVNAAAAIPFRPILEDITEVPKSDKIWTFLNSLSLDQKIQAYTYLFIYGEIFGYQEKVDFGVNAGLIGIKILHPLSVDVIVTDTFPIELAGFTYWDNLHGERIEIELQDMVFVKYFNPDADTLMQMRGLAPVRVLSKIIERERSGVDISVAQMQNGGTPGIVYDEAPGLTVEILGQHRDNFGRFLTNPKTKGAPYFAGGKMGYISIGSSVVDMDLINVENANIDIVCNVYHVSSTNFNNKAASTESNVVTHDRSFYTKGVLPSVKLLIDGLNRQSLPFVKTKAKICEDISDITELQPNMKEIAEGLAAMPFVVPNDMFEKLGWPRRTEPLMDEVWSKSGYTLAEESSMVVPTIDNSAGDYNNAVTQAAKLLKIA